MGRDKFGVQQVRVGGTHAIDLVLLAGRKIFLRIEAPGAGEQPLPTKEFMDAGYATGKAICGIEEGGI